MPDDRKGNELNMERRVPALMNISVLSTQLGVSKHTIYDWCAFGKIPYVKLGKFIRFDQVEIGKWLEEQKKIVHDIQE